MFQCNECHTEYGGIRGISADRCPRCAAKAGVPIFTVTRGGQMSPPPLAAPAALSTATAAVAETP